MPEYRVSASVHVTPTGDGALVLLETRAGTMFRLNHTGATMWNALSTHGGDLSLAARAVAQRYGTPFHQVLTDTRLLVGKLTDAGLLEHTR
ncbi:MAG: PqqD family protein [Pseudonocardiaceae bacterium]